MELVLYNHFDNELRREVTPQLGEVGFRDLFAVQTVATPGQITIEESRFLGDLVRRTDPADPVIEIGTLFGSSSRVLTLFKDPSQRLITVDNFCWNPLEVPPKVHEHATRA